MDGGCQDEGEWKQHQQHHQKGREHHTRQIAITAQLCGIKPESVVCGKRMIATGLALAQALVINGFRAHGMVQTAAVVFLVLASHRRNVAEELEAVSASAPSLWPRSALQSLPTFEATCSLLSPSSINWPCPRRRRPLVEFIGLKGPDLIRSGVSGLPASPVRDRMQQTTLPAPHRRELGSRQSWNFPLCLSVPLTMLVFAL